VLAGAFGRERLDTGQQLTPSGVGQSHVDHAHALARAIEAPVQEVSGLRAEVAQDRPVGQPPEGAGDQQAEPVVGHQPQEAHAVQPEQATHAVRRLDPVERDDLVEIHQVQRTDGGGEEALVADDFGLLFPFQLRDQRFGPCQTAGQRREVQSDRRADGVQPLEVEIAAGEHALDGRGGQAEPACEIGVADPLGAQFALETVGEQGAGVHGRRIAVDLPVRNRMSCLGRPDEANRTGAGVRLRCAAARDLDFRC